MHARRQALPSIGPNPLRTESDCKWGPRASIRSLGMLHLGVAERVSRREEHVHQRSEGFYPGARFHSRAFRSYT